MMNYGTGAEWLMPRSRKKDGTVVFTRRPFAKTTVATSNLVSLVAEECATINEVLAVLERGYDPDAIDVVRAIVAKGWGDLPASILHGSLP